MPLKVEKRGNKYCLVNPEGKTEYCHDTKQQAIKQMTAININKHLKAEDMSQDPIPAIVITSDGTPGGTTLFVHGQKIEFDSININCYNGDYSSCDITFSLSESDEDGLEVRRTFSLRKTNNKIEAALVNPNAKVRNRGKVVFDSKNPKVKDKKDHFPINDANQARNALSRVAQFSSAPSWWSGSLKELQAAVRSAVKRHYKGINVTE